MSSTVSSFSIIIIWLTLPPSCAKSMICFFTFTAPRLTFLKSKIILLACLAALRSRFLIVLGFELSGLFISHMVPSIKASGLFDFSILVGLISSILKPNLVRHFKVFSSASSVLIPFLIILPILSLDTNLSLVIFRGFWCMVTLYRKSPHERGFCGEIFSLELRSGASTVF